MFGVVWMLLLLALFGAVIAVVTGVATTFRELGMLYGIGGWPGRIAALHGLVWVTAFLYVGPPESDWIAAPLVGVVLLGTLCGPFYLNNRRLLETIRSRESPASSRDILNATGSYLPVSGTVRLDPNAISEAEERPLSVEAVTSPFTATECAAYEWAVKRKQRLSRGTTYKTVEHGRNAGEFVLDTTTGKVGVTAADPKLLLVFDGSLAGYATTTDSPSRHDESPSSESPLPSLRSSELKYCESTITDGDPVTVVGPVDTVTGGENSYPAIIDAGDVRTYLIDADYDTVKRTVERYVRWTPQIAVSTLTIGWAYIGFAFLV